LKMNEFEKLGLSQKILDILRRENFEKPLEIQEKIIPLALAGKDVIGKSETGSGKTLAFALPIIEKLKPNGNVQVLVLTPTRELAEQITKTFEKFLDRSNVVVASVYGGVNINNQIKRILYADIIVGTPGRLLDHLGRNTLELSHVKFLVLDEVDRMFDMGFYPDVERIISKCPKERQTLLFSATISHDVEHLSKSHTKNAIMVSTNPYVDPTKLKQIFYGVQSNLKFCNTKRAVDMVAKMLKKVRISANAIHGDLAQNKRQRTLSDFHKKNINVLVCTDVAARGLDIKGVTHVYNYDIPSKADDYIHRIGRTARAKKEGKVINLLSDRDYENFDRVLRANPELKIERKETPRIEVIQVERDREDRFGRRDSGQGRGSFGRRDLRRDGRSFGGRDTGRDRRSFGRGRLRRQ